MKTPAAKARVSRAHGPAPQQQLPQGCPSAPAHPHPKAAKRSVAREARGYPQRDQLALERVEHLQQLEAFIGSAMAHVLRLGLEGPLNWPALVLRPDGSRVQAPEEVVERAAQMIEEVGLAIDAELRNMLKLAPDGDRKKYRLVARRQKDRPDESINIMPAESDPPAETCLTTPIAPSARPPHPANAE